jgi:hypothetical protein
MEAAAVVAAVLIGVVIVFQVALAAGAPFGAASWGGQHAGQLPMRLRLASIGAVVLLAVIGWVVLAAAGLVARGPIPEPWLAPAVWVAAVYFAVGTVANLASRSRIERVWGPVALVTAVCCVIVALG